jgi:aryl carrier-like protein
MPGDARQDTHHSDIAADVTSLVLSSARDLLDREDITVDEDFFTAGGDSIAAMHLVGQLARRTGLRLRTSLLFANPVLRDFLSEVELVRQRSARTGGAPAQPLAVVLGAAREREDTERSAS